MTTSAPGTVTTWKLDPAHSSAEFKVKHMMISNVKGSFSGLSGALQLDEADDFLCHNESSRLSSSAFSPRVARLLKLLWSVLLQT